MGEAPEFNLETFTLELWFKWNGTGRSVTTGIGGIDAYPLITKGRAEGEADATDVNYFLGVSATSSVLAADFEEHHSSSQPGQNHRVEGRTTLSPGIWYHAAATYDGRCWQLYLNGQPETDGNTCPSARPNFDSVQHFALGSAIDSRGEARGHFDGLIDEVRWQLGAAGSPRNRWPDRLVLVRR
jgi:hypothetical protein